MFNGLGLLLAKSALFNNEFKFPNVTIFGINFGGRRRRDAEGMDEPIDLTGLLSLMDVLDPDRCLPLALCSAAAVDPINRTEQEQALLNTIGYTDSITPLPISELNSHSGHAQYAVMVGSLLHDAELCLTLVPECPLSSHQAITLLTMPNSKCQQMDIQEALGNTIDDS